MPSRKRKLSTSTTSSKMYRRLYKKQKKAKIPLQIGAPEEMTVKLVYHDSYTHTHTSGAMQLWEFRANSCFDPDYTYTGHQPTGFDEMAALYQRYLVTAAMIEVSASPISSADANVPQVVAILPRLEQNSISDLNTVCENPKAVSANVTGSTSDANNSVTIKKYINIKKILGVKNLDDLDYSSTVTSSPTQPVFFSVYSCSANQGSTSIMGLTVKLTFWVKFYKKQTTTSS